MLRVAVHGFPARRSFLRASFGRHRFACHTRPLVSWRSGQVWSGADRLMLKGSTPGAPAAGRQHGATVAGTLHASRTVGLQSPLG
jgi:hypothetical protein